MGQVGQILLNLLVPPLVAAVIGLVALGLGSILAGPFFPGRRAPLVESFALGTLVISLLTLFWSFMGWMGPSARWSLALLLMLVGALGWIQTRPIGALNPASFQNRTILILSLIAAVGVLLRIILSPMLPPLALEECRTNLPNALAVLNSGRMFYHFDITFNSFPQNAEMLYLWAIMKAPYSAAHYVNFIAFVFSLLAIVRLGRVVFSVKIGWLASVLTASMGSLQMLAGQASPDMWLLFYVLAGSLALAEGLKERSGGRILLAGIFFGASAGVSYIGLLASVTLAISLLALEGGPSRPLGVPGWSVAGAFVLFVLVALPWYARNVIWFLNPVFPFFSSVFKPGGGLYSAFGPESTVRVGWLYESETLGSYYGRSELWAHLLIMWSTWVAIPAGIWFWTSNPFVRVATAWTLLTWAFWMIFGEGVAHFPFYICLVPANVLILANLLAVIYCQPSGDRRGRFFRILLWIFFVGWIGIFGARASHWLVPITSNRQAAYLGRLHPSYNLMMAANEEIAPDRTAVGILCEDGRLYAKFILIGGGDAGWANHRVISDSCTSPRALAALLHERYHASHLIIQEQRLREQKSVVFSPIKGVLRSPEFHELFREVARVSEGVVYSVAYPDSDLEIPDD